MQQRKYRPLAVSFMVCLVWGIYILFSNKFWQKYMIESMQNVAEAQILPVVYNLKNTEDKNLTVFQKIFSGIFPFYGYCMSETKDMTAVNIIGGENVYKYSTDDNLYQGLSDESTVVNENAETKDKKKENISPVITDVNAAVSKEKATGTIYNRADLYNNDFLRSHFYTITSITSLDDSILKGEEFLNKDMSISHDASTPQILIFHTHSQENFVDSVEKDVNTSIVGVGNYLTQLLSEKYGYNVIHDTSVYDYVDGTLDRSKAYTYAEEGVQAILDENPSIDVVIDLHRDGVTENTHLITEIDGKQMSKIMFFNGVSYSNNVGDIEYLSNPNRDDNLAMSLQMQLLGEAYYPGYLRNIYINAYRYCLHMRGKSMLIEAGAQTNTVSEEMNAMEPLADMLDKLLKGEKAY